MIRGADVVRGHDALELRQAIDVAEAIVGRRDWRTGSATAARVR
jgi:dihydropteroate synthase